MVEDEQEARSVKYWDTYKVARLSSGRFAVFDYEYEIVGIFDALSFDVPPPREYHYEPRPVKKSPKSSSPKPSTDQLLDLI